jgi:hypothetical protein
VTVYVQPGQDITTLPYEVRCGIVAQAADDDEYLRSLSEQKRRDVLRAAAQLPYPEAQALHEALLAMINSETALAAAEGDYDEWPSLRAEITSRDDHERPFFRLLYALASVGAQLTVWTCAEVRSGELRVMRAIYRLDGTSIDFKLEEYWPNRRRREGYPAVRTFVF